MVQAALQRPLSQVRPASMLTFSAMTGTQYCSTQSPLAMHVRGLTNLTDDLQVHAQPHLFFLNGAGGTGKTMLYNLLLAAVRSEPEHIALAVASSGIAAQLLKGGRTAHSRFKIPVDTLDANCTCPYVSDSHVMLHATLSSLC